MPCARHPRYFSPLPCICSIQTNCEGRRHAYQPQAPPHSRDYPKTRLHDGRLGETLSALSAWHANLAHSAGAP